MKYSIEHVAEVLKKARVKMGISQRALGQRVGVPQSHISKIEAGLVDLQASSLIELARALDLELMFVPRQLVPMVQSMLSGLQQKQATPRPMYRLEEEGGDD